MHPVTAENDAGNVAGIDDEDALLGQQDVVDVNGAVVGLGQHDVAEIVMTHVPEPRRQRGAAATPGPGGDERPEQDDDQRGGRVDRPVHHAGRSNRSRDALQERHDSASASAASVGAMRVQ